MGRDVQPQDSIGFKSLLDESDYGQILFRDGQPDWHATSAMNIPKTARISKLLA